MDFWGKFEITKIINEDARSKHLAVLLRDGKDEAVALFDKLPFNPVQESLKELVSTLKPIDVNDIYHRFIDPVGGFQCKLIFPASAAHIKKYSNQERRIISETPAMHRSITRPYFDSLRSTGQIDWIENILNDTSETERRLIDKKCPESGFILLPDYKWTEEDNLAALYLLVIVRQRDLWSVRDLDGSHLPLLKEIRDDLKKAINRYKYPDGSSVEYEHLRVFFHYPPTYPHLHIHVTLASSTGSACSVGQAILLDEVIDNLENVSSKYYSELRNLPMEFGEKHELYARLCAANLHL